MHFLLALILFLFSSIYVVILDSIAFSSRSLQQALVLLLLTVFIILYKFSRHSWKELTTTEGKFFFILWGTVVVQLLVLATGGLQSPFLILIHLFMLGLSFVFSFSVASLFLLFSLVIIFIDLSFSQNVWTLITNDPSLALLQLASLVVIIPIAYLVSRQYHMKDTLAKLLQTRIKTTEKIFENLPELIIITDAQFRIVSTNDAAIRTLQRSRSELLDKPLFDMLLLKNKENKLVTAQSLFPDKKAQPIVNENDVFTLVTSPISQRNVTLQIQYLNTQISFIISFLHASENTFSVSLDKARAKYEALMQGIKTQMQSESLKTDMLLLEKIENDTYILETLNADTAKQIPSRIDVAQLCKKIVSLNQDFAKNLHVTTSATLPHFGQEEIAPLTIKNYPVNPDQLTGPFFTVECDAQKVELVIEKLFDIGIFLAATPSVKNPHVTIEVEGAKQAQISIKVTASSPKLLQAEIKDLFVPYYSHLADKTNLQMGSGLEGFLVKQVTELVKLPLTTIYQEDSSEVIFTLMIPKKNGR